MEMDDATPHPGPAWTFLSQAQTYTHSVLSTHRSVATLRVFFWIS